ncbi:MAG TPA: hypothetical protein VFE32_09340 [Puia sp.]|jgi:hypothetical protein|nr:hypothetical protein [Puia sp.]
MDEKQPTHSEEIDLTYFFAPVTRGVRRISDGIAWHFAALKANIFVFLGIFLAISAIGIGLRYIVPGRYNTEGIFASRYLPASYCARLTSDLDEHLSEPLIRDELHLNSDLANNITGITFTPLTELLDQGDSSLHSFVLHLYLKNMDQVDSIQRALVGFYENNEYSVKMKENRGAALHSVQQYLDTKIASLDSLSRIVNNSVIPRSTGQGIILGQPVDPVNVYMVQDSFVQKRVRIQTDLNNLNNIEVIQSFMKLSSPNYPHFRLLALISLGSGLILAFFLTPFLGRNPYPGGTVPLSPEQIKRPDKL